MSKKCITPRCRGHVLPNARSNKCSGCRSRQYRANSPISAHFSDLRNRAKQRGHEFTITLEEYTKFWHESGYGEKHGKTKDSFSIDRIKPELGYVPGNIRAKTLAENTRLKYVPYFKNRADELAAVATLEGYNARCQAIGDALAKIYPEDSDEWRLEYTRATNNIPRPD